MESDRNGSESSGAHSVTPGLSFGRHQRRVLGARAVQQMARRSPGADLQQLEAEHVIERQRRQRRLFAQHARARAGPRTNRSELFRAPDSNHGSFMKILAKFECYRLNTPQNVNPYLAS